VKVVDNKASEPDPQNGNLDKPPSNPLDPQNRHLVKTRCLKRQSGEISKTPTMKDIEPDAYFRYPNKNKQKSKIKQQQQEKKEEVVVKEISQKSTRKGNGISHIQTARFEIPGTPDHAKLQELTQHYPFPPFVIEKFLAEQGTDPFELEKCFQAFPMTLVKGRPQFTLPNGNVLRSPFGYFATLFYKGLFVATCAETGTPHVSSFSPEEKELAKQRLQQARGG
jgi:hypothetical protein